jgi:hypothetical protein
MKGSEDMGVRLVTYRQIESLLKNRSKKTEEGKRLIFRLTFLHSLVNYT